MWSLQKLKENVKILKKEVIVVSHALADARTPWPAKLLAFITVGYMLSPIDLVPDFIPVLGLLDDLLLVPFLIRATLKIIPKEILDDIRSKIDKSEILDKNWYYAIPIIMIYVLVLILIYLNYFH